MPANLGHMGEDTKRLITETFAGFPPFPEAQIDDLLNGQKTLVLAHDADDGRLGCMDLIAASSAAGRPPFVVMMTEEAEAGRTISLPGLPPEHLFWLGYRDSFLPSSGRGFEAAVRRVELIAAETGCTLLLAPRQNDPHRGHWATAQIAAAAAARGRLALRAYKPSFGGGDQAAPISLAERRSPGLGLATHNAG